MAIDTTPLVTPQCPWCGNAYRRSSFDRQYCCPVCGQSLADVPEKAPGFRVGRTAYAVVGLVVAGGFAGYAIKSLPRQPLNRVTSAAAPLVDVTPDFTPSEEFRRATAEKAALLERDLAQAPKDHFLLASLSETYLFRALAEQQVAKDPAQARRWLRRATACVDQLDGTELFASFRLRRAIQRFPRLRFSRFGWPTVTAPLWRLQAGKSTLITAPVQGASPFLRRRDGMGFPPSDLAAGRGGPPPGMSPVGPPPAGLRNGPLFGSTPPGAVPGPLFPRFTEPGARGLNGPGNLPGAPAISRPPVPDAEEFPKGDVDDDDRLTLLRLEYQRHPEDPFAVDALAGELLRISGPYQPVARQSAAQREAKQHIEEAAEIYLRGARTARLRVHRAAFYIAAADARRRLEQWEEQYALLRRAAEYAPFAAGVWQDLKTSALRLGKVDESLAAGKKEELWRFPGIEPVESAPPGSL